MPNGDQFGPLLIIGDGTDVWGISPTLNEYTKHRPSDLPTIQAWVKAAKSAVFDPPIVLGKEAANLRLTGEESIAVGGKNVDCYVIKLISRDHPEYIFWVEKTRFTIRRIRSLIEPSIGTRGLGLTTTSEFLIVNIGVAVPDSTFVFTPSPSATDLDKNKP